MSKKLDLNALTTPITLSTHQIVLVEQFIADRGSLTLESIDTVITATRQRSQLVSEKINNHNVAGGIDIGVVNECERIPVEKRTNAQKKLANITTERRATENMLIDQYLNDQLSELEALIRDWLQIRQIFVDIYPEAKTSPRMPRSELEASPTRFSLAKSKSSSALASPRVNGSSSPRYHSAAGSSSPQLTTSAKMKKETK